MSSTVAPFLAMMNQVDDFFRFVVATLIVFSLFGFGLFEAGISRNAVSLQQTFVKTLLCALGAIISFWLFGYALAFGGTNAFGGGQVYWGFSQMSSTNYAHFWLQFSYAALSAIIALGSLAERCHIATYVMFPFLWCGFVYPIIAHWVWHPNGWLNVGTIAWNAVTASSTPTVSFLDAAGSGVVLLSGGISALFGAFIIRPRLGRFQNKKICHYRPHSNSLVYMGGSAIILGLLAFNGSGIEAANYVANYNQSSNGGNIVVPKGYAPFSLVSIALTNTVIAGAVGAFTLYFMQLLLKVEHNSVQVFNAALSAMGSISCVAPVVLPWAASIFGLFAALAYLMWSKLMQKICVDDVIDAYAVYAGGAMWGLIAAAFLTVGFGIVWAANIVSGYLLAWQLVGICAIWAWAGACSILIFGVLRLIKLLRIPEDNERIGLGDLPTPYVPQVHTPEPAYTLQSTPSVSGSIYAEKLPRLGL